MAVCPLLAQLPPSRRQSRDVQPSPQLCQDQAGPLPFQPVGHSLSWASVQLTRSLWELDVHAMYMTAQLSSPDNPSQLTWH